VLLLVEGLALSELFDSSPFLADQRWWAILLARGPRQIGRLVPFGLCAHDPQRDLCVRPRPAERDRVARYAILDLRGLEAASSFTRPTCWQIIPPVAGSTAGQSGTGVRLLRTGSKLAIEEVAGMPR